MSTKAETVEAVVVRNVGESAASPYTMAMQAIADPACDPARLSALLAVRREWESDEAKKAFNAAVVRFQQECPIIVKGDSANGRAYAKMDRIWSSIRGLLDSCGLAVTWESCKSEGDMCVLDGHLRHSMGHSVALHQEMPYPDKINGQNATQRAGSGQTYCKRYATMAALGIQTGVDTDGGASGAVCDGKQVNILKELCAEAGRKEEQCCAVYGVKSFDALPENLFIPACNMLESIKSKKAKEGAAKQ
jgi:hypothetical protein